MASASEDGVELSAIAVTGDRDLREALVTGLAAEDFAITATGGVAEFYQALLERRPYRIAIIDLGLPADEGLTLVRFLAQRFAMGVIILVSADASEERINGLASGADLYIVKPVECRELAVAARRLARRHHGNIQPAGPWRVRQSQWRLVSPEGTVIPLTPKEMVLVNHLASQAGQVVRREEILFRLGYGQDATGNRGLDALVRRLRIKAAPLLGDPLPLSTMHGIGYHFSAPLLLD